MKKEALLPDLGAWIVVGWYDDDVGMYFLGSWDLHSLAPYIAEYAESYYPNSDCEPGNPI